MSLKGWVFIVNPASGAGSTGQNWPKIIKKFGEIAAKEGKQDIDDVEVMFTAAAGEASILTREAITGGAKVVVAVGGDGSISEVVQGFFDPASHQPLSSECALGILPAGTGGDFKRMLPSLSSDTDKNIRALLTGAARACDVGKAQCQQSRAPASAASSRGVVHSDAAPSTRFFLNIASLGSSGLIAQLANDSPKFLGGALTYFGSTLRGLATFSPPALRYRCDGAEWKEAPAVNTLAVCNGKYFGGGMMIGPGAEIDSGQFYVTIVSGASVLDFMMLSNSLYTGEHVKATNFVATLSCKTIEVESVNGEECVIEVDGETPWHVPASFSLLPGAIKIIS